MDFGQGKMRRNRINTLCNALHPVYGLVWTDGRAVFLASVDIVRDKLKNVSSTQLVVFDDAVESVSWCLAPAHLSKGLLCVVHTSSVTVCCITSTDAHVILTQLHNISRLVTIPQGCVWSPVYAIICVLTSRQCYLYTDRQLFPLLYVSSGTVSCACWSGDGTRLVIAVGSILHIYEWQDIENSVDKFTVKEWKIPDVDGRVCALAAVDSSRVVCTTELPLDLLCHTDNNDLFQLPDTNDEVTVSGFDDAVVLPGNTSSHLYQLLNLQRNPQAVVQSDCSQLVMFDAAELDEDNSAIEIFCTNLSGLVSPNLLHVYGNGQHLAVGSNTSPVISLFHISRHCLVKSHQLKLSECVRPKGLCGWPGGSNNDSLLILVMTGQVMDQSSSSSVFIPSSVTADYQLRLQLHSAHSPDDDDCLHQLSTVEREMLQTCDGTHQTCWKQVEDRSTVDRQQKLTAAQCRRVNNHAPVKLPEFDYFLTALQSRVTEVDGSSDTDELETERADFHDIPARFQQNIVQTQSSSDTKSTMSAVSCCSDSAALHRFDKDVKAVCVNDMKTEPVVNSNSQQSAAATQTSLSQQVDALSRQISDQAQRLSRLECKVDELITLLTGSDRHHDDTYRPASDPDLVFIRTEDQLMTKAFILDSSGRLRLDTVRQVFGSTSCSYATAVLQIIINGVPCVVGADSQGYIPLRFTRDQLVDIVSPLSDNR